MKNNAKIIKQLHEQLEKLTGKKVVFKENSQTLTIEQYLTTSFYKKLDILVSNYLNANYATPEDDDLSELVAEYLLDNEFPGKRLLSNYFTQGKDYQLLIDSLINSFTEDFEDED